MRVQCSNLTFRFYKREGWTEEKVLSYVKHHIAKPILKYFDDPNDMEYWIPVVGTTINIEKIFHDGHEVFDFHGNQMKKHDANMMNW